MRDADGTAGFSHLMQSAIKKHHTGNYCDGCEEEPVAYVRKYSGQGLCTACFRRSISRKTAKTISKYDMIGNGDRVAVAVSGGKDSLALLHIIHEISQTRNFEIVAITIDEGIPGYRNEALDIVASECDALNIRQTTYAYKDLFDMTLEESLDMRSGNSINGKKISSCTICGILRRRAIDIPARDVNADVLATGLNLDDMLQTFLINMLSGDTDKIAWMSPGNRNDGGSGKTGMGRIKPFCEIYESEIVFYAYASNLPFQQESCPHMNEGIRTEIREFFNSLEAGHSGIKNSMYASVLRMIQAAGQGSGGSDNRSSSSSSNRPPRPRKQRGTCSRCGADCTGSSCSACDVITKLAGDRKP